MAHRLPQYMVYQRPMTKEEIAKQYPLTPEDMYQPPIAQLLVGEEVIDVKSNTMGGCLWCIRDKSIQKDLCDIIVKTHGAKMTRSLLKDDSVSLAHAIGALFTWNATPQGQKYWSDFQGKAAMQRIQGGSCKDANKVYYEWNEQMDLIYKQQLEDKERQKELNKLPIEKKQEIADKINDLLNNI